MTPVGLPTKAITVQKERDGGATPNNVYPP